MTFGPLGKRKENNVGRHDLATREVTGRGGVTGVLLRSDFIPLRYWRFNLINLALDPLEAAAWSGVTSV